MDADGRHRRRVRRVGGVLIARAHDDRALLFAGRGWSYVQLDARIPRAFAVARRIAWRLERVDGRHIGRPHLPAALRGRVAARLRSFEGRC